MNASTRLERAQVLRAIRTGRLQFVLVTDQCARGLDLVGLTHVFQLDVPASAITYLHRAGRVGRIGPNHANHTRCAVVTLTTVEQHHRLQRYAQALSIAVQPIALRHGALVESVWGQQYADAPTASNTSDSAASSTQPQPASEAKPSADATAVESSARAEPAVLAAEPATTVASDPQTDQK